jgi:hypothetical protein
LGSDSSAEGFMCGPVTFRNDISVNESFAIPPNAKASLMPHTGIVFDPSLAAIERPPCKKCEGQMMFTGMASGSVGFDIRTFECIACDYIEKVASSNRL